MAKDWHRLTPFQKKILRTREFRKKLNDKIGTQPPRIDKKPQIVEVKRLDGVVREVESEDLKCELHRVSGFVSVPVGSKDYVFVSGNKVLCSELEKFGLSCKSGSPVNVFVENVPSAKPGKFYGYLRIISRDDSDLRVLSDMRTKPAWRKMKWLKPSIDAIYAERDEISARTGIPHEVDHIDPVTHPLLCGLTVPWNLQVISATENRRKGNRIQGL
jgi:hypothetical protein